MYLIIVSHDFYVFSILTTGKDHLLFLPQRKQKCWAQNTQSTSSSKATPDKTSNSVTNLERSFPLIYEEKTMITLEDFSGFTSGNMLKEQVRNMQTEEKQVLNKMAFEKRLCWKHNILWHEAEDLFGYFLYL